MLELNPQSGRAPHYLGLVRLAQGRLDEAMEAFQRESHDTFRLLGVALVQHARGRDAESRAALQAMIDKNFTGNDPFQIAEGYAYRGEADLAFEWLECAYAQRDPGINMLKVSPLLRSLHADPRWQPFLEKMGLGG
jgi:tetratricopeptide (TPR) repeat protein